jgi:hypothetical protein
MKRLTPPTVLLERSFLEALADPTHPHSERASGAYRSLVERSRRHERRLRARADHLTDVAPTHEVRRTLFAPVESIHVAGQHHRAAARLELPIEVDHDVALTLVVLRREHIAEVATFEPALTEFDLQTLP